MHEDDVGAWGDCALTGMTNQTCHALAGVDGVQQYALSSSEQLYRFVASTADDAICLADISVINDNVGGVKSVTQTKASGAGGGDPCDLLGAPFWIDNRTDGHHPGRQAECPDTNVEAGGR